MKHGRLVVVMVAVGVALFGMVCVAQELEPPLKWEGEGEATFISPDGTTDIEFEMKIDVDADGYVSGEASTDEGDVEIERLYYSESVEFERPELEARKIVLVLRMETSDTPSVLILVGQVVNDKLCYGEIRARSLDAEGVKNSLSIGNKMAELIDYGSLPYSLRKVFNASVPLGCFQMTGGFVEEEKETEEK